MKTSQKGFISPLLLALIAVLLIGGGVYAYVQNKQASQPVAAQTSDWKTYTNSQYGFEVKYPLNWFLIDCVSYVGFSYSQSKLPLCSTNQSPPHINITVTEGSTPGIEKYIEDAQNSLVDYSKTEMKVGGNVSATKLSGLAKAVDGPGPTAGTQVVKVLFSRSNTIYQVYYYMLDNKDYSQVFDQMLSTFKFTASTAQTSNSQIANWKVYSNTRYSYTIKYPSNWYVHTTNSEKDFTQRGLGGSDVIGGDTSFSNYQEEFSYDNPAPSDLLSVNLMIYKIESNINYDQFISSKGFHDDGMENISINGISALRLTGVTTDHPVGVTVVNTFIKVGNKMFLFNYSGSPISQQLKDNADEIINSFVAK
ncbi:MAG: hypothetical protein NUV90_03540 [Candidatus Parcubacteria bacterium]|nr:hypothetical protein [Candidatus Parcubacteria bacterium]